jgi:hypothetical protein
MSEEIELRDGVCCFYCHFGAKTNFSDAVFCKKDGRDIVWTKLCNRFVRKEDNKE